MSTPRTLVCILAETRAWAETWPSFKANVLDHLGADLAIAIGVTDHYDQSNPFWQLARYRWTATEYADFGDGFDEAQAHMIPDGPRPEWRKLLGIKNQWLGGIHGAGQHPGSAGILIYFRWLLLKGLKSSGALERYDRFVITRSDFVWPSAHPSLTNLEPDSVWVPDGESYGGLTDRHAVLTPRDAELYLDLIRPIVCETDALYASMRGRSDWNLESYIRHYLIQRGMLSRLRYFPYVMYSAREQDGTTRWSKGVWNDGFKYYIKYPSEYAAATFWRSARSLFKDEQRLIEWTNTDAWIALIFQAPKGRLLRIPARRLRGHTATPAFQLGTNGVSCFIVTTGFQDIMLLVDRDGYLATLAADGSIMRSPTRPGHGPLLELRAKGEIPAELIRDFGYLLVDVTLPSVPS